jgi:hypothetical protein
VVPAAGELPHQPRVDGAEGEFAALRALAGPGHVVQEPAQLAGGEIRVEHEPGPLRDEVPVPGGVQLRAGGGGAPVLPDDRRGDGSAGPAIPHDRGLALIGDADGREVSGTQPRLCERREDRGGLRFPDFLGIMLHPPGPRIMLPDLPLRRRNGRAGLVEHDRPRAGRALVYGEHMFHPGARRPVRGEAAILRFSHRA